MGAQYVVDENGERVSVIAANRRVRAPARRVGGWKTYSQLKLTMRQKQYSNLGRRGDPMGTGQEGDRRRAR